MVPAPTVIEPLPLVGELAECHRRGRPGGDVETAAVREIDERPSPGYVDDRAVVGCRTVQHGPTGDHVGAGAVEEAADYASAGIVLDRGAGVGGQGYESGRQGSREEIEGAANNLIAAADGRRTVQNQSAKPDLG